MFDNAKDYAWNAKGVYVNVVRKIIEKEFSLQHSKGESERVSQWYVVERIKSLVPPQRLYNKILTYNDENRSDGSTNDGVENINRGAKKLFRDSIHCLPDYEIIDNWIYRRENASSHRRSHILVSDDTVLELNGEERTLSEWGNKLGIASNTLRIRLLRGSSVEEALTNPLRKRKKILRDSHPKHLQKLDKMCLPLIPFDWIKRNELLKQFEKVKIFEEYICRRMNANKNKNGDREKVVKKIFREIISRLNTNNEIIKDKRKVKRIGK